MTKILLIEDDLVLRENTAELLELSDYEVITGKNGKEGISLIKTHLPDIVICDIMMPVLDGYGVLKALSEDEKTKYIPFIFLSAKIKRSDIRKGMNLGADDYISKPFTEEELIGAIESRLAKASILHDYKKEKEFAKEIRNLELETLNDLKNFFDDNGKEFSYDKGDVIYNEGGHSNYVYLIINGAVKTNKIDEYGKELIIAIFEEDELFGMTAFSKNKPYEETAIALSNVDLVGITKNELKILLENNPKITFKLIELLNDNLNLLKNQLLQLAYSSVNRRTASTILKFASKMNKKPGDTIRITRSDLASVAGIALETMSRTLTNFKNDEIIQVEGRTIKILDLEKLKHIN